jgi:hypothetical protein
VEIHHFFETALNCFTFAPETGIDKLSVKAFYDVHVNRIEHVQEKIDLYGLQPLG